MLFGSQLSLMRFIMSRPTAPTSIFMNGAYVSLRTEAWIHTDKSFNPEAQEERMDNETALTIYEAERCIECGCCIGGCATANIKPNFIGATGVNRVARFMADPRDERNEQEYFDVVGSEDGILAALA